MLATEAIGHNPLLNFLAGGSAELEVAHEENRVSPEAASEEPTSYWDYLKTAGKITIGIMGAAGVVAALISGLGILGTIISASAALPIIAQLGIAALGAAVAVAAFVAFAKLFPEATPPAEAPVENTQEEREVRLRRMIAESLRSELRDHNLLPETAPATPEGESERAPVGSVQPHEIGSVQPHETGGLTDF